MDRKLLLLINRDWTGPVLDRGMAIFSSFDFWVPLLIAGAVLLIWKGDFRARAFLLVAALSVGLSDGVVSKTLKRAVNRPRPAETVAGVRQVDLAKAKPRLLAALREPVVKLNMRARTGQAGRSFPSSHVCNMMAVASVALLFFRKRGWAALAFAGLVAYSRIYTGAHWPSDVVASLFLGAGVGILAVAGAELLWHFAGARCWPRFFQQHASLIAV